LCSIDLASRWSDSCRARSVPQFFVPMLRSSQNGRLHNPRDLRPDAGDIAGVGRFAPAIADLTLALADTPPA
jgi:hypothetical protein